MVADVAPHDTAYVGRRLVPRILGLFHVVQRHRQHDAHDFLEKLVAELAGTGPSPLNLHVETHTKCAECDNTVIKNDLWHTIGLTSKLHGHGGVRPTLQAVLDDMGQEDIKATVCEKCGTTNTARRTTRLQSVPRVVCLHMLLFDNLLNKSNAPCLLQSSINLSPLQGPTATVSAHVHPRVCVQLLTNLPRSTLPCPAPLLV